MKWEYKAIHVTFVKVIELVQILNEYGEKEWELIQYDLNKNFFVFKRSKNAAIRELSIDDEVGIRKVIEGYFGGKVG